MTQWDDITARRALRTIFDAAVSRALPKDAVLSHLPEKPLGRCVVVGAGKASAAMAAALDVAWPDVDLSGVVVTRYGHAVPAGRIRIIEASHPVPDANSTRAAHEILASVQGLSADDLVIALISGGGSALMVAPAGEMTLQDKQAVNQALLASGAAISEMNIVRKHLSRIKGGRLALAAQPAKIVSLLISDVPGDDPSEIASGPTVPDTTSLEMARAIVARYQINLPDAARRVLELTDVELKRRTFDHDVRLIATPVLALKAAAEVARKFGLVPVILGDALEGEARDMGKIMAGIAASVRLHNQPVAAPAVLLSGGETTVTIGSGACGRGGRNMEFLLSLAISLKGRENIWAIAGDTDGIDGVEDAAGAMITPDTLARMQRAGINPVESLSGHDSYTAFKGVDDLVVTGPTLTNVNDIRAILIA
jgi:glycerate 2-kinase